MSYMDEDEHAEIEHDELIRDHEDDMAKLFSIEGDEVWIPRSVIIDDDDEQVIVKKWWAVKNGLAE